MAYGISTYLIGKVLNHLNPAGSSWTKPTTIYVQPHKGDPGANGTANIATSVTRQAVSFAISGNTLIITGTPPSFTAAATESWVGVSFWDAATAGNFLWSSQLAVSRSVVSGDTPTLISESFGFGSGIAA